MLCSSEHPQKTRKKENRLKPSARALTIYVELRDIHAIRGIYEGRSRARRVVNLAVDFKPVFTAVLSDLFASAASSLPGTRVHVCVYFFANKKYSLSTQPCGQPCFSSACVVRAASIFENRISPIGPNAKLFTIKCAHYACTCA